MFAHPDEQCLDGYSGALCLACAKSYVKQGTTCTECSGGASFLNAFLSMIGFALAIFLFLLGVFACAPSRKNAVRGSGIFGQVKIILSFLQILAAMPGVFDNVPWPVPFVDFTFTLRFVNLDFLSVFIKSSCSLSVPFLDQFVLHMILPVLLMLSILLAYVCSLCCLKANKKKLKRSQELKFQLLLLGVLFLYPGLATKIFSVFRCKTIDGIEGQVLVADFSIKCYDTTHVLYSAIAGAFLGVYIIGIPFFMFLVLWRNRKHLHMKEEDKNSNRTKQHLAVKARYGGLYLQYEPEYWVSMVVESFVCSLVLLFLTFFFTFYFYR